MAENTKTRNGDKEKMTKARGALDSIGKAGKRGPLSFYQRFLRITFRTFRCSCARTNIYTNSLNAPAHTYTYIYTRVLFPLSVLPLVSVDLLFYPHHPAPRSPPSVASRDFYAFVILATIMWVNLSVCVLCVYMRVLSIVEVSCRVFLCSRGVRAALYVGERKNVF